MKMKSIAVLFRKDIIDMSRNGGMIFIVSIPLSFSLIYGKLVPAGEVILPTMAIVSTEATDFTGFVRTHGAFDIVDGSYTWNEAVEMVNQGEICGAILVPDGFPVSADSASKLKIALRVDASDKMGAAILQHGLPEVLRSYFKQELPVDIDMQMVRGDRIKYGDMSLWITLAILVAGINMVPTLLVEERDRKTLDAILVTMTSVREIVLGKVLVGMFMAVSMAAIILTLNQGFTGNVITLVTVILVGAATFVLLGIFIGSISRNVRMASLISSLLLLPMMVSASMAGVSTSVRAVSRFLPSFYVRDGIEKAVVLNGSVGSLWEHFLVLGAIGVLAFLGSIWFLRRNFA